MKLDSPVEYAWQVLKLNEGAGSSEAPASTWAWMRTMSQSKWSVGPLQAAQTKLR